MTARRALAAFVVALFVAIVAMRETIEAHAPALVDRLRAEGGSGIALFGLAYTVAVVAFLPAALFTMIGGYLYGPIWGAIIVWPISMLASGCAFMMGRTVARPWARRRIEASPRLAALDKAVGENGLKLTFLLRLSPVAPFNLLNYLLGASRVRFRDFLLGGVGSIPSTFLYVNIGSLAPSAAALLRGERPSGGIETHVLTVVGIIATLAVTVIVGRIARKALARTLREQQG